MFKVAELLISKSANVNIKVIRQSSVQSNSRFVLIMCSEHRTGGEELHSKML